MNTPLRALVIAATGDDRDALGATLRSLGYETEIRPVEDIDALREALSGGPWDAILSGDRAGGLTPDSAVRLCKELSVNISLIIFTAAGMRAPTEAQRTQLLSLLSGALAQRDVLAPQLPPLPAAELFRLLVEESDRGVYLIQNGRFIYANRKVEELSGYSRAELLALPSYLDIAVPEDRPLVEAQSRRRTEAGENRVQYTFRCRRRDGAVALIEISGGVTLMGGRPALFGSAADITQKHKADEALRLEREIISESPVVVSRVQLYPLLKTEYISGNIRKWGYEPEDFYARRVTHRAIVYPGDVERQVAESQAFKDDGTNQFAQEYRVVRRDGQARWVYDQTTFRRDAQGRVTHTDFSWLDVTEKHQADEELRRSLALQQSVLEATADGILVIDRSGKVAAHNRRFAELWNIPEALFAAGEDQTLLDHVLNQLRDPGAFIARLQSLYRDPKAAAYDLVEFRDGRVFERFTHPYLLDGAPAGRVWSFRDITEREQSLEQIKYSLVLMKSILESTADGLLVLGKSGKVIDFNQRFIQLWRVPRSALQSTGPESLLRFMAPQVAEPERFLAHMKACQSETESELFDTLEFSDGRTFERFSIPYRVSGQNQGRVWSYRDITQRRQAEASLRTEREIISESPVVVSRQQLHPQRKTEYISENIRQWGYAPGDFYSGKISIHDIIHPQDVERQRSEAHNYRLSGPDKFVQEYRIITRDNRVRWIFDQSAYRRDPQGTATHADFSMLDITERKMTEAGLAMALQRLRTHVDKTPLAVIEWSPELKVVAWNPAAEALFGVPAREASGRDAAFIMTDASLQRMRELSAVMSRGGSVENPTLENLAAGGRVVTCRWYNTPLVNAEGKVYGIASLVQDLTELLRTRRELEEFIFATTHDLKSPLLSLRGFAKLAGEFAADPKLRDMLGRISANAERMDTLIAGVLDYARLGYRPREEGWTDITAVARRMIEELVPEGDRPQAEIVGAAEDPWEALVDPVDLERMIGNLFANAQAYRHPDRPLRIRCGMRRGETADKGMIGLYLSDNGIGIPENEHQYIFRLFTRLQPAAAPRGDGHGLGLAIVKRLAEDYGGRVSVESQPEGSCFTIWLPRSRFRRMQKGA
jgi:PAS domain S-box-containing protein